MILVFHHKTIINLKKFILLHFIFSGMLAMAQQPELDSLEQDSLQKHLLIIEGDSVAHDAIGLDEVVLLSRLKFDSKEERLRYLILRRKVRKVYPYAKLAAERMTELNKRLNRLESNRQRKKYTKIIQRYIEDEFSEELKKLTRTEGQILVKLMHRQTGITTFDLVKDYRSGWNAFWYNTTASMFDISLKEEYDPVNVHEDYLIEDILQRSFRANVLEPQPTVLDFEYIELTNKWKKKKPVATN